MFSLCGVLSGLFLAVDFQLNNKYRCRGAERGSEGVMEGYEWGMEAHSLWTIVYAVALFLFTLAWLLLEREVLSKKVRGEGSGKKRGEVRRGEEKERNMLSKVRGNEVKKQKRKKVGRRKEIM